MKLTTKSTKEITWKEIKEMVDREEITLKVGDEIEETLKDGTMLHLAVAAVDLYQSGEIIFVQKNILGYERMNKERTNEGGWAKSDLREKLNTEYYDLLPDDLKAVITPRTITQTQNKKYTCQDYLWLPSEEEYAGDTEYGISEGNKQFQYYAEATNRISTNNDDNPTWKWTRTPSAYSTSTFCYINGSGYTFSYYAYGTRGVALSFWIRKS